MPSSSVSSVAIILAYFFFRPNECLIDEYSPLYLEQLGYSAAYIGLAPILGILTQTFAIPPISYMADRFRARKLLLFASIVLSIPCCLLFLAPPVPVPNCDEKDKENLTTGNGAMIASLKTTDNYIIPYMQAKYSFNVKSMSQVQLLGMNSLTKVEDANDAKYLSFFVVFIVLRGIFELTRRLVITLITVAAMGNLKQDKSKYGYYACWGEIGCGVMVFAFGLSLGYILRNVCGNMVPDYVVIFFFAVGLQIFTLGTLPFMNFEYHEHAVIDYEEVRKVLCDPHYILILVICCLVGWFEAFQSRWEFWYIAYLEGGTTAMAVSSLLRRPFVAAWYLLSHPIICRFGELNVIAFSLFLFAVSFLALAFVENAWIIIPCDIFQSASYVLSLASIIIHFSKVGSKASSTFFQGLVSLTFYGIGKETGTAIIGYMFSKVGTTITLCSFAGASSVFLAIFLSYLVAAKDPSGYMKLPKTDDQEDAEDYEDKKFDLKN